MTSHFSAHSTFCIVYMSQVHPTIVFIILVKNVCKRLSPSVNQLNYVSNGPLREWLPASNPRLAMLDLFPLEYRRLRGDLILTYALFEKSLANRFFAVEPANTRQGHRRKIFKLRAHTFIRQNLFSFRVVGERQPLTDQNKSDPGNLGNSLNFVYRSMNPMKRISGILKLCTLAIPDGMGTGHPGMYAFVESEPFAPTGKLLFRRKYSKAQIQTILVCCLLCFVYLLFRLNLLFHGLRPDDHLKCVIYVTLVLCARKLGLVSQIIYDPKKVTAWLAKCQCSVEELQNVWRILYETHSELGETRRATEALVYLLSTFTEATAAQARQDAIKCIISVIQDPSLLAHDQLHTLKPIQFLEGEPVHDVSLSGYCPLSQFFKIFVSGNLSTFKTFLNSHPDFLIQNGLDENACLHKLRLLTLMQLSENQTELSYDAAARELELPLDELEPFIIEVRTPWIPSRRNKRMRVANVLITGSRWLIWLEHEFTDRKVRGSNPTCMSRLPLFRLGQSDSIPAPMLPSGGMTAMHRESVAAEKVE
ncbi:LOW QUALITY PROTEIN: hypothetical protein T265_14909 [Opisthorchis viverrini]|uniref:PCI domain-containing protein n=1 Tax=Opisthorchis viverrini TaxID=6198 RepID=A0A074Z538_OPIVI|nr:LOW QUALITY PROTEIN: hypothetical protein T265_14909 [Opisthorchis viverrini]KER22206.1 LOW QUALITY PROTEIN: hypothetical protein T265_14909 [Opisthorchis viverrini]